MGENKEDSKKIQDRLDRIEEESRISSEDQLFFGAIVAIALFVLTLSVTDIASFIQAASRIDIDTATRLSQSIKNAAIICLVLSAILRYYAAIKPSKKARLVSLARARALYGIN